MNANFIRHTYQLALKASEAGDHPFAAIAVRNQQIVASALNQVVTQNDSTQHAELKLASFLSKNFSRQEIETMTVYASTEPCVMCAGALFWTGVRNIVFGCSIDALGKYTRRSFSVSLRDSLVSVLNVIKIEGPVLETEGEKIHMNFWNLFRGKK
jgi:tRNA(Arg) A34 adenosine deaminase TadA